MQTVFFSGIRNQIISHLDNAANQVQVAMAWFTSSELFDTLLQCLKRNVSVELILLDNAINFMDYAPDFNQFIKAGGKLRIANSCIGFMHHKFCIIDNLIAITGSYNWTYYAETRNIENILISDDSDVIKQFSNEFQRLKNELSLSTSCARLTWDDLEQMQDIDFRELNYEIESICEVQNKPIVRVFETKTEVVKTEIKKTPLARYDIGLLAIDGNGNESFQQFIHFGEKLPRTSNSMSFFFDSKNEKEFKCKFIYENPLNKTERGLIREVDLMQIAKGTCDENLRIQFSMNLDDNGSLRVDISCTKSGQRLTVSALNSKFVKYE